MLRTASIIALSIILIPAACAAQGDETALLQDFEGAYQTNKWPGDHKASITVSTEWKSDGQKSLKMEPGPATSLEDLKLKNWTGYTTLRFHAHNPGTKVANISFELYDPKATTYWDRHLNSFGVQPGDQVIDVDFSGGLWRSETNNPYKGAHKTPIEIDKIVRMALTNQGTTPIYIDQVEIVKVAKIAVPGGFAFDFGRSNTTVMGQYTGVTEASVYDQAKGFGFVGGAKPFSLHQAASYPTTLLADGLAMPKDGFRLDLPGGKYRGWIAYERAGFWQGEQCGYTKAALAINGVAASEHTYKKAGGHFLFQDTEITEHAQIVDHLVWPSHAIAEFAFDAAAGANIVTLETSDHVGTALRIAGLVVAPDTTEGKAFIAAHDRLQRAAVARTFAAQDKGRRDAGRVQPAKELVVDPLPIGEQVYPRDWPLHAQGASVPRQNAVAGQTVVVHLGVFATKPLDVTVAAVPLTGSGGTLSDLTVAYGRYMPARPYANGVAWLEINHYRPEPRFSVGPELTRSLVVEYAVPMDAKEGGYDGAITLTAKGLPTVSIPVSLQVLDVKLADIPIPVGLFMNSLPFGPQTMDSATWWKLQEQVVRAQVQAGINTLSGGPGLGYEVDASGAVSGADAVRYVQYAQKQGVIRAVIPYGGFLTSLGNLKGDYAQLAKGLEAFEQAHALPPTYVYAYDEPATDAEYASVIDRLTRATAAGLRTTGYTSTHKDQAQWEKLIVNTHAPSFNIHTVADIEKVKAAGRHFFVYNNGLDRYGFGINLWRSIALGAEARMNWIGMYTQGFAFNNLDGREPSYACFLVHDKLGVLTTPMWMSTREGLLDARLRLTLERCATTGDPALALWSVDGYRTDKETWTAQELDRVRTAMLHRIQELTRTRR
ncbi:MAG: hypothetical protein H0V44_14145 [Planctomycetes bacterium]|nr:hypothetical protein [Planctomycetota bacterium]